MGVGPFCPSPTEYQAHSVPVPGLRLWFRVRVLNNGGRHFRTRPILFQSQIWGQGLGPIVSQSDCVPVSGLSLRVRVTQRDL